MIIMSMDIFVILFFAVVSTGLVNGTFPWTCPWAIGAYGSYFDCNSKYLGHIPALPYDTYYLDLRHNNLTEINIQFCEEMPYLQYIYISYNLITKIPKNTFVNCELLYIINLQHNNIKSIESYTFVNMKNLYQLHLYTNELSTLESFIFMNLPSLRDLNLTQNNISHIREQAFGFLPLLSNLVLSGNPLNCDCSIFPFWSWLFERSSIATNAQCSNGTLITSLQSPALDKCNPDNCHCFNGGKCVANGNELACDCIGQWTGAFCQESPCISHDCGFGNCYIEPVNGTAQCLCDDRDVNFCPVSFILLTKSAVVQTAGQTCEDIDTSICTKLGQIYSGFCNDSCISKLCRRSCGMCPVKCYECHEVDEPRLCTNVTQCPDIDHYCFATRSFADNFKKIYKLGCAPKSICKENFGSTGKRDLRVDAACCSYDQCNNRFPEEIQGSSYTTSTKEPTETSSTIKECQNIDEDICTRIAALYPGFCINESCAAAKLCPRMCRQCFRCYSCNEVDNVKDCNVTALCQGTKQCFSMETLSMDDLRPVIRLGCMETKTCQRFTASPGIIFGKRQSLQPKGGCCHSDLCNHNLASSLTTQKTIPTPSPTTTTAAPRPTVNSCNLNFQSQCPTGYIAHNNFCYLFGTVSMSWNDAKNYCTSHCGSLIDFVSENEMGHTMRYFLHHGPGHLHIDGSYWSAATTHHGSFWVWDSTGKHLTSDFTHDLGTTRFGQCGSVHHHLESTSCASRFPPACKTTIRS